jgi:hypothetical protein
MLVFRLTVLWLTGPSSVLATGAGAGEMAAAAGSWPCWPAPLPFFLCSPPLSFATSANGDGDAKISREPFCLGDTLKTRHCNDYTPSILMLQSLQLYITLLFQVNYFNS